MAVDTAAAEALTLKLTDDLADAPARGVERAVEPTALREAADLLLVAPSKLQQRDADVWLLRVGAHAISALVAERDGDGIAIPRMSTSHAEPLLRAVLGHYALEGLGAATLADSPQARALGFS
jgi:hypothetical protein